MPIYKRGRVWWIDLSHNGHRIRRATKATNKGQAEKIYAKVTTQLIEGTWFDLDKGRSRTFRELSDKYEIQVFKDLKSWKHSYCYFNQLRDYFGAYVLSDITPALIDDFKQVRKATGVSPSTINRQLNILKRMLNLAKKRWQWLRDVPPIEMEPNADKKRVRYLTFEVFHRVIEHCEEWLKDLVMIAAWTGLRQGNVINLKREQVSLIEGTITIEPEEMKNEDFLKIPLSQPAWDTLKKVMKVTHIRSPYVFCQEEENKPFHQRQVQRAFKKAVEDAGLDNFRFHDLRHCFASWNRQAGVDIDTLADLLGHKDTRMTRRYAHINTGFLRQAVNRLDNSYSEFVTISSQSTKKGFNSYELNP